MPKRSWINNVLPDTVHKYVQHAASVPSTAASVLYNLPTSFCHTHWKKAPVHILKNRCCSFKMFFKLLPWQCCQLIKYCFTSTIKNSCKMGAVINICVFIYVYTCLLTYIYILVQIYLRVLYILVCVWATILCHEILITALSWKYLARTWWCHCETFLGNHVARLNCYYSMVLLYSVKLIFIWLMYTYMYNMYVLYQLDVIPMKRSYTVYYFSSKI
jgi:hypothetical protein